MTLKPINCIGIILNSLACYTCNILSFSIMARRRRGRRRGRRLSRSYKLSRGGIRL
nr:MAG TPA: hypothetical protein [Microviridae sp.]